LRLIVFAPTERSVGAVPITSKTDESHRPIARAAAAIDRASRKQNGNGGQAMATFHWKKAVSSSFNTAANWTPAGIPGVADAAVIDAVGTYTLTGKGKLTLTNNANNAITSDLTPGTVADATLSGSIGGTRRNPSISSASTSRARTRATAATTLAER